MTTTGLRVDAIDVYTADVEATAEFSERAFGLAGDRPSALP
jgi:hypothetical protein